MKNSYFTIGICAMLIFLSGMSTASAQNNKNEVKKPHFSIFIKTTADGMTLTCNKGCEWKELSLKTPNASDIYAVNFSGVKTYTVKNSVVNEPSFMFTIERAPEKITLEGKKGTSWKTLAIPCPDNNCSKTVDDNGITQLN